MAGMSQVPQERLYELALRYGDLDIAEEILNRVDVDASIAVKTYDFGRITSSFSEQNTPRGLAISDPNSVRSPSWPTPPTLETVPSSSPLFSLLSSPAIHTSHIALSHPSSG